MHLNLVIYGWSSLAGIAIMIWVMPRMFHTALRYPKLPVIGAVIWNVALILAVGALAHGWNDGEEWLEIPWQIDLLIALAGVFFVIPLVATARARKDRKSTRQNSSH